MENTSEKMVSGAAQHGGYAGFWARVAAYFVDFAVITILSLVISIGMAFIDTAGGVIAGAIVFLINLLYWPAMESSSRQATFGKSLAGIIVTDLDGGRLTFGRALLRAIAKILSAIPLCIGFLLAAFTARKQALHDMLAKTLVVRVGPSHLFKLFAMAVGGLAIVIGGSGAYFYYIYLPQMTKDITGVMKEAAKSASTAPVPPVARKVPPPAPEKPVTPQAAKEPAPAAPASPVDAEFDGLFGPALTGFDKPSTTRAGPAILKLSNFYSTSFRIRVHLPRVKNIDIRPDVAIVVNSVLDTSGRNYHDSDNFLESEPFINSVLNYDDNPVPHLFSERPVHIKPGLKEQALQKIEGQVRISVPVDAKPVAFGAGEVGKKKLAHGAVITLKSCSGNKMELHHRGAGKILDMRGYGKDGARVKIGNVSWGGNQENRTIQIDFEAPASKVEILIAAGMVERQFPFSLVRGAVAGPPPSPTTVGASPSASASPVPASTAAELEAVYAKFHSAVLARNFDEMRKYAVKNPELESMPANKRQSVIEFSAKLFPRIYAVADKSASSDGNKATLHLTTPGGTGKANMTKESNKWKVVDVNWEGELKSSEMHSAMQAATADLAKEMAPITKDMKETLGTGAKEMLSGFREAMTTAAKEARSGIKTADVSDVKVKRRQSDKKTEVQHVIEKNGESATTVAPDGQYQPPPAKVITTKFNDVMTAVVRQDQAAVIELLDLGWWVDKPDPNGFTPLMEAVAMGDAPMAELLLRRGANPNTSARNGSILQIAKHNHNAAMVELLRRYGARAE